MAVKVWFSSDLHLGHKSILGLRSEIHNKLFPTTDHWNDFIISNWNSVINPKDIVWVLGDVVFGDDNLKLIAKLNGHKRLVLGNHDKHYMKAFLPYFERIAAVAVKYNMVMSHVPIHPQELEYRWTINVHGHIHKKSRNIPDPRYVNVNTDTRGGFPVSLEQIREETKDVCTGRLDNPKD